MGSTQRDTPSAAFGLALAGGIIIVLAGIAVAALGALVTFFLIGIGAVFGIVGIMWGVLIITCAILLRSMPERHVALGVLIIIFALFSWFGAFGGFLFGFILSLLGGFLAVTWSPRGASLNVSVSSGSVTASAVANVPSNATRFCSNCGSAVNPGSKFCRSCGQTL